jgi:hypothetical protein
MLLVAAIVGGQNCNNKFLTTTFVKRKDETTKSNTAVVDIDFQFLQLSDQIFTVF